MINHDDDHINQTNQKLCGAEVRSSPHSKAKMVKSTTMGAGLAIATAVCGSYQAAKAFVPAAAAPKSLESAASLRGASQEQATASSSSGASMGLLATGALGLAAAGSHRSRTAPRRAAAEAPPPPPPFNPAEQRGVTAPFGFFDPAGFSKVGDEEGFRKLRTAEIKHGRVAMMAAVGAVVQHYLQFPGFQSVPKGILAVTDGSGIAGFAALTVVSGALEILLWKEDPSKSVDSIGDYGNPLQLGVGTPLGEGEDMRNRELNNGRAAMFAAVGIIIAELLTGKDGMQQLGFS
jgi:hypothetical protein